VRFLPFLVALSFIACSQRAPTAPTPPPLSECHWLGITAPPSLAVGVTATLSVFREFCRPNFFPLANDQVAWTSLNADVATVDRGNLSTLRSGAVVIDVALGSITQQTLVIVGSGEAPPESTSRLAIYGSRAMVVGQRAAFGTFTTSPEGAVTRVTASTEWQSSNPGVLGESGVTGTFLDRTFDAHAAGSVTITASYRNARAQMRVDVRQVNSR
jgi:hypothetical protein